MDAPETMTADTDANFIDARGLRCPLAGAQSPQGDKCLAGRGGAEHCRKPIQPPLWIFSISAIAKAMKLVDVRTEGEELHFTIRRGG
jgi:hypothetical protein